MNTIKAILDPNPDGTLYLPLPLELRRRAVKVVATLEPAEDDGRTSLPQSDTGTVLDALIELRKLGGLRHVITDAAAWQREQREDRALPGRG